jgi:5-oxoprolinase (ATP-hydrolysing) subunit A
MVLPMRMTINCDMGEGYGIYRLGNDAALMPLIDLANVACGYHASDPSIMHETVRLAKQHGVKVGAHPSLPDMQGFGRRAMAITPAEVEDVVTYQVGALMAFLQVEGVPLNHVKPHGALYGMAARDEKIAAAIADAVRPFAVPILGMAFTAHETVYKEKGIELIPEFYADLEYDGDRNLILSRVHDNVDPVKATARLFRVIRDQVVKTTSGLDIPVKATTVCVHCDTPSAVAIAAELSRALRQPPGQPLSVSA